MDTSVKFDAAGSLERDLQIIAEVEYGAAGLFGVTAEEENKRVDNCSRELLKSVTVSVVHRLSTAEEQLDQKERDIEGYKKLLSEKAMALEKAKEEYEKLKLKKVTRNRLLEMDDDDLKRWHVEEGLSPYMIAKQHGWIEQTVITRLKKMGVYKTGVRYEKKGEISNAVCETAGQSEETSRAI